jgi:hypothetical protein
MQHIIQRNRKTNYVIVNNKVSNKWIKCEIVISEKWCKHNTKIKT